AVEPARFDQFLGVDRDLLGQRLGQEAHHQGRWERPWLRGEVADAPAADARLLPDLPAHRILQRLARLHEPSEAGEAGTGAPVPAAEQRALAPDREHDDDRVDARKVMRFAVRATPRPATGRHVARRSALGAEAVPRM